MNERLLACCQVAGIASAEDLAAVVARANKYDTVMSLLRAVAKSSVEAARGRGLEVSIEADAGYADLVGIIQRCSSGGVPATAEPALAVSAPQTASVSAWSQLNQGQQQIATKMGYSTPESREQFAKRVLQEKRAAAAA